MARLPRYMTQIIEGGQYFIVVNRRHPAFRLEVLKAKILGLWCDLRYGKCDYECHYCHPYGFAPEVGCPVHD